MTFITQWIISVGGRKKICDLRLGIRLQLDFACFIQRNDFNPNGREVHPLIPLKGDLCQTNINFVRIEMPWYPEPYY